jgi:hypothetical protein
MPLDPYVDSLDGLHEAIAREYVPYQGDNPDLKGKFILNVPSKEGFALENVTGLKNALENEKASRRKARELLARYVDPEGKPLDPDRIAEMFERLQAAPKTDPQKNGNGQDPLEAVQAAKAQFDEELKSREKRWKSDISKANEERDQARTNLRRVLIENQAQQAIGKHDGIIRALMPHVLAVADLREIEGVPRVVIVNEKGEPRISRRPGNTGFMDLDEFVGEILKNDKDFRGNFKGTDATGGGSGAVGTAPPGGFRIDPKLPAEERLRLARRQASSGS